MRQLSFALCLCSALGVEVYKSAEQARRGHWGTAPGNSPVFHDALQLRHHPEKYPERAR